MNVNATSANGHIMPQTDLNFLPGGGGGTPLGVMNPTGRDAPLLADADG